VDEQGVVTAPVIAPAPVDRRAERWAPPKKPAFTRQW
jgi:hypothetical protein